jgi:hypothetical protein
MPVLLEQPEAAMKRRSLFLIMLAVSFACPFAAKSAIRLTYSNYSLGTWTTFALPEKNSFLNVAKADFYFSGYGLIWYVGVPLQYSVEYYPALGVFDYPGPRPREIKWSLYIVDASTWIGKDFGAFSPRLGFDIPTGYPDNPNIAWIGSGSVRLSPGLGYSIGKSENRFHGKIDAGLSYFLTSGAYGAGSYAASLSLSQAWRFREKWETAAEMYATYSKFDNVRIGWYYQPWTVVPSISVHKRVANHEELGVRLGYGATFGPVRGSPIIGVSGRPKEILIASVSCAVF